MCLVWKNFIDKAKTLEKLIFYMMSLVKVEKINS